MSSNGALLELDGVEARYGPIKALHGVSLRVGEGEVVALLGANGAGKTTTLRVISGIVKPMAGSVSLDGADLAPLSPSARARSIARRSPERIARLGIAHVPEGRGLFSELTVWDNLRMGAYVRGERKTIKQEAARVAAYFPWLERPGDFRTVIETFLDEHPAPFIEDTIIEGEPAGDPQGVETAPPEA